MPSQLQKTFPNAPKRSKCPQKEQSPPILPIMQPVSDNLHALVDPPAEPIKSPYYDYGKGNDGTTGVWAPPRARRACLPFYVLLYGCPFGMGWQSPSASVCRATAERVAFELEGGNEGREGVEYGQVNFGGSTEKGHSDRITLTELPCQNHKYILRTYTVNARVRRLGQRCSF